MKNNKKLLNKSFDMSTDIQLDNNAEHTVQSSITSLVKPNERWVKLHIQELYSNPELQHANLEVI